MTTMTQYGDVTLSGEVKPEWVDYNNHMNLAYYLVAFDLATDQFFERLGIGKAASDRCGETEFALETHVSYRHEVRTGEVFWIRTLLVGYDRNKLHLLHSMFTSHSSEPVSLNEVLTLHVDVALRRAKRFRPEMLEAIRGVAMRHRQHTELAGAVGRSIKPIGWPDLQSAISRTMDQVT